MIVLADSSIQGSLIRLDRATRDEAPAVADLDWVRSLNPAMAGWFAHPEHPGPGTVVVRSLVSGVVVGVIDGATLPGYPGVISVSVFTDARRARGGWALEAYALYVNALFEGGARVIHHEVLELNRPIQRILKGIGVSPTVRMRDHAFVAGRFWDVLVFSYDRAHWARLLTTIVPRNPVTNRVTVIEG